MPSGAPCSTGWTRGEGNNISNSNRRVPMNQRLKYFAVWAVAALCVYFLYRYFTGTADPGTAPRSGGFDWDNKGPALTYKLIWLSVLLPVFFLYRPKLSELAKGVLLWGGLTVFLVAGYAYRYDLEPYAAPVLSAFVPGYAFNQGTGQTVLSRSGDGHFRVNALVNGIPEDMLVDTGASTVTLTFEAALAAGYHPSALTFSIPVSTANGFAKAAAVRLDTISVGAITFHDVNALIAEQGRLRSSLLGLSFLSRLSSYSVSGDRMTMIN